MDYLANSLDVPEAGSDISEITIVSDSSIKINNFINIISYDEDEISIMLKKNIVSIIGLELNINYITDKFIQINGFIKGINFEGSD